MAYDLRVRTSHAFLCLLLLAATNGILGGCSSRSLVGTWEQVNNAPYKATVIFKSDGTCESRVAIQGVTAIMDANYELKANQVTLSAPKLRGVPDFVQSALPTGLLVGSTYTITWTDNQHINLSGGMLLSGKFKKISSSTTPVQTTARLE